MTKKEFEDWDKTSKWGALNSEKKEHISGVPSFDNQKSTWRKDIHDFWVEKLQEPLLWPHYGY